MIIRYARPSRARARMLAQLVARYGDPSPWRCPLHSLQLHYLCHACARVGGLRS